MDELAQERVQKAKLAGEAALRSSGLGYVIVRPGPLLEEAGGYRALVFDQSRRITKVRRGVLGVGWGLGRPLVAGRAHGVRARARPVDPMHLTCPPCCRALPARTWPMSA